MSGGRLEACPTLQRSNETAEREPKADGGATGDWVAPDGSRDIENGQRSESGQQRFGGGLEMDIVSHDVRTFLGLLLKVTGSVLEQLYSPLIFHTTAEHAELKAIDCACSTRHHAHHYFGFAAGQWKLFLKASPR
jgi:hypothetical protein